jgi:DNA-binding protein HU-beta
MNKRELVDAVSAELGGSRRTAVDAVEAVLGTISDAVADGDKVSIAGFGIFEKHLRPPRTARNPATGATVQVAASVVPKFRPGAGFRAAVKEKHEAAG